MKNWIRTSLSSITLSFVLTLGAQTFGQQSPWYFKVDAGGNIMQNTSLEYFFGPVASGSKVDFDPGFRFELGVGYQVTDWFALEAEAGTTENFVKSISDATDLDALFVNVPLFVNAKFRLPNKTHFTPYIGGGVGAAFSILNVDSINLNGVSASGVDTDAVFAYQGFAGLRYSLADNMGLGVEYRYIGSQGADYGTVKLGDIKTHVFSVVFDLSF